MKLRTGLTLVAAALASAGASSSSGRDAVPESRWSDRVATLLAAGEYEIRSEPDDEARHALQAVNRRQDLRVRFLPEGVAISRRTGGSAIHLSLRECGTVGSLLRAGTGALSALGVTAVREGDGWDERWQNREDGLRIQLRLPWSAGDGSGEVRYDLEAPGGAMAGSRGRTVTLLDEAGIVGRLSLVRVIDGRGARAEADLRVEQAALVIRFWTTAAPAGNPIPSPLPEEIPLPMETAEENGTVVVEMTLKGAAAEAAFEPSLAWGATFLSDDTPAIAGAGDVNGDGFDDVLVGSDASDGDAGSVALYLGTATGLEEVPTWEFFGSQSGERLGAAVAGAGDVNGDGFGDVIVGAPLHDDPGAGADAGRALLFLGSPSGPSPTPDWEVPGMSVGDQRGASVAGAGDVNGDGYDDVVVGAPFFGLTGIVAVYPGGAGGPSTTAWLLSKVEAGARFGSAVAGAGDVDSDGYHDVLVGSPRAGVSANGSVFLFAGGPAGPSTAPVWSRSGTANSQLGFAVGGAGDVNGDGFADVVAGAPRSTTSRVEVYAGSAAGLLALPLWTRSASSSSRLGESVAGAGDVDGDGRGDILVGEPREGPDDRGVAYLHAGTEAGPAVTADWSATIPSGNWFGAGVAAAGDVNDDGFADYLVASPRRFGSVGEVVLYLGGAFAPLPAPSWTIAAAQPMESLGVSVASAGDVNGDGFSDVVVGAPLYDGGQVDEGRALLFLGGEAGTSLTPAWSAESNRASAFFGGSVASAGDVDGDGHDDVIIGARGSEFIGDLPGGMASLYRGTPDGLEPAPSWTQEEPQVGAAYGQVVASAGDVNGDGFGDVLVGALLWDGDLADEGRVSVYLGSDAGLAPTPVWSVEGDQLDARFGVSAASAGDVDGDSLDDIVIGAYRFDGAQVDGGRAFLFPGATDGLSLEPRWIADGEEPGGSFGFSVAGAGDVNGDGFADILVGALQQGANEQGRAFLYLGSLLGPSAVPDTVIEGLQAGEWLGTAVSAAGDVNSDGFDDVLIGARLYDGALSGQGLLQLHLGSASGVESVPAWTRVGDVELGYLGISVAAAGDVNADGFDDILGGANGAASLWLGNRDGGVVRSPAQRRTDGGPLPAGSLLDGDGAFHIRTVGCSPVGRIDLRLEWQIAAAGEPFAGAAIQGTPAEVGVSGACVPLEEEVTADAPGTASHWRARVVSDDPGFRATPWISPPGRSATASHVRIGGCPDRDGDGFGRPSRQECPGHPLTDCDDREPDIFPGASQLCDGLANDCDDPEWPLATGEADADGDGLRICDGDCDDARATVGPGLPELCDGLDNDCDGIVPAPEVDRDEDGHRICAGDCDDSDARRFPGNPELCDAVDNDCDLVVDGFATVCGIGACLAVGACEDGIDSCTPGAPSVEVCDGLDNDCDDALPPAEVDVDLDGISECAGDCAPTDPSTHPGAPEVNDGLDNQCPGEFGFGSLDEISGTSAFSSETMFCWPAQVGATTYRLILQSLPGREACVTVNTGETCLPDLSVPAVGLARGYVVGPATPQAGSMGTDSDGLERPILCTEGNCGNGLDDDADGRIDCADVDCLGTAGCPAVIFEFVDTGADDLPDAALWSFLLTVPTPAGSHMRFSLSGGAGMEPFEWCSDQAATLRDRYLQLGPGGGNDVPLGQVWYRGSGSAWSGPVTNTYANLYGSHCLAGRPYSWCSLDGLADRTLAIDPGVKGSCEALDGRLGCPADEVTLTIAIGPDRLSACGF